jgi:hypothetical protein
MVWGCCNTIVNQIRAIVIRLSMVWGHCDTIVNGFGAVVIKLSIGLGPL